MGEDRSVDERDSRESGETIEQDISDTTAPSIGPHTVIEHVPVEERLAQHEQSNVDAMGLDKRREVVGGQYGASATKQIALYGTALAIIVALVVGFIILAGELDKPPKTTSDEAPWSNPDAPQTPVSPLE